MLAEIRAGGPCAGPYSVRYRIAHDSATIQWYADLLDGRTVSPEPWDTASVLRWLGDNKSPRYLSHLLRFSRDTSRADYARDILQVTSIGLTYHARAAPAARARLVELARGPEGSVAQGQGLFALLYLNDEEAREELRRQLPRLRSETLRVGYRDLPELIRRALDAPPCPPGRYWQVLHGVEGQVWYRCARSWY